jgi:hypothetical protein
MSVTEITVPEEMVDAVYAYAKLENSPASRDHYQEVIRKALCWQKDHPPTPTLDWVDQEICKVPNLMLVGSTAHVAVEWVKHMYDKPAEVKQ